MTKAKPGKKAPDAGQTRDDRLKAALKANLARRKAQTRAGRSEAAGETKDNEGKG